MERINKPRSFLSHSSLDKPFIEKLATDLRKCQIEPWLDTEEIRDGRSWLKVIFEDGIPTCDAVIVYFTENSLRSKMVEKELDATVVEQLTNGGIALLPYVSKTDLRKKLRSDIRTLQCREWNEGNYADIFPSVVSEIWRSYVERIVNNAVLQEKSRRLELEVELKQLQEQYQSSVFTATEEHEFQYLSKKLTTKITGSFPVVEKKEGGDVTVGNVEISVSALRILLDFIDSGYLNFDHYSLDFILLAAAKNLNFPEHPNAAATYGAPIDDQVTLSLSTDLLTYGLTEVTRVQQRDGWAVRYEFTHKMYRLKYWLDYKGSINDDSLNPVVKVR